MTDNQLVQARDSVLSVADQIGAIWLVEGIAMGGEEAHN